MKRRIRSGLIGLLGLFCWSFSIVPVSFELNVSACAEASDDQLLKAFQQKRKGVQVSGRGKVMRVLKDDTKGSRHQRFILKLASGQTLLIAHNIDIAPRIPTLKRGDSVGFYGEYVWNAKGGVVHWTHRDLKLKHVAGWLEHRGKRYQ